MLRSPKLASAPPDDLRQADRAASDGSAEGVPAQTVIRLVEDGDVVHEGGDHCAGEDGAEHIHNDQRKELRQIAGEIDQSQRRARDKGGYEEHGALAEADRQLIRKGVADQSRDRDRRNINGHPFRMTHRIGEIIDKKRRENGLDRLTEGHGEENTMVLRLMPRKKLLHGDLVRILVRRGAGHRA